MWYDNPLVQTTGIAVLGGAMALIGAWFSRSKARINATQKEEEVTSQTRLLLQQAQQKEDEVKAQIQLVLKQTELAEAQRLQAVAEAKRTAEIVTAMATEQTKMASVMQETHAATNSAKTLLDTQIATARNELELARRDYAALERLTLAEKATLIQKNEDLQRQLTTLALSLTPTIPGVVPLPGLAAPPVEPVPVVLTDAQGVPAALPLTVVIQEKTP